MTRLTKSQYNTSQIRKLLIMINHKLQDFRLPSLKKVIKESCQVVIVSATTGLLLWGTKLLFEGFIGATLALKTLIERGL